MAEGVSLLFFVRIKIELEAGRPVVEARFEVTVDGIGADLDGAHEVDAGKEVAGEDLDTAGGVLIPVPEVLQIEPGVDGDSGSILAGEGGVDDLEFFQFIVIEDNAGVDGQAEFDFELIEALEIVLDGIDPGKFATQRGLAEFSQFGLLGPILIDEGAFPLDAELEALVTKPVVLGRIAGLDELVVTAGDANDEILSEARKVTKGVEDISFRLGEGLGDREGSCSAEEGLAQGGDQRGALDGAEISVDEAEEINGEVGRNSPAGFEQPVNARTGASGKGAVDDDIVDALADRGPRLANGSRTSGTQDRSEFVPSEGEVEGLGIESLLALEVLAIVVDGEGERVGEGNDGGAHFHRGGVTQIFVGFPGFGEVSEGRRLRGIDGKVPFHVRDRRALVFDDLRGLAIGGLEEMTASTGGEDRNGGQHHCHECR